MSPGSESSSALRARVRQQAVVAELGQQALETDDLDQLMDDAAAGVADTLDCAYAKVLECLPGDAGLLLRQGVGWADGLVGSATVPTDRGSQAGYTLQTEEPVVVDHLGEEARFSGPDLLCNHDVISGISVVIGSVSDPWGILGVHTDEYREFTQHDATFVQNVANVLASAIENARATAELEASNERLEQFAYAASHDLQEPLRMVSSYLQLIEDRYGDRLDEDGEEFLEFAVDGAERMREMIDALLAYSRVETRGEPFERVDLDSVLEDVRADLALQIEETDATVTTESLPQVEGDAEQLRQLLQNLIDNALTYAGDEPPTVDISAERVASMWELSVADGGIGIDPAHTEDVFEVFNRLHSREAIDGTGIGLALCERIVERHGGEIWVASEPGDGSTFTFTLPVVEE